MPPSTPPNLRAKPVSLASPEFREIRAWDFPSAPFFVAQMRRFIDSDLPQRLLFHGPHIGLGPTTLFAYTDPTLGSGLVGFGTLSLELVYDRFTLGRRHYYIPVLSVKPGMDGRGYGKAIVDHLVESAATGRLMTRPGLIDDRIFLDVYAANSPACGLYTKKCGFEVLNEHSPEPDLLENGEPYFVMAKNIARVSPNQPPKPAELGPSILPDVMPPTAISFTSDQIHARNEGPGQPPPEAR